MRNLLIISTLLLAHTSYGQLHFYRTDSIIVKSGTDTLDYPWAGGMNYCQFSVIDLNLDGKKDLMAFDRTFNQPITFINTGSAGQIKYKYDPQYEPFFPNLSSWAILRDYNCDGKEDIFTYSPGGIAIYRNISDTILKFELVTSLLRGIQCTSNINIYVSSVDIPSIEDIDDDGDLDILTFGVFGTFVEYHKNFSIELGYGCDSLKYQMKNQRWGWFSEDPSYCQLYLNQSITNCAGVGTPEMSPYDPHYTDVVTIGEDAADRGADRHSGSTLLAIDLDGTNSKDVLITDVSCKTVSMLMNSGTAPNTDSPMNSQDTLFPSYDVSVNLDLFPACFHLDVNNDGKRDLVVAPNSTQQSDNTTGNWLYLNTGTETVPVFSHTEFGFMQSQMIETGEGALPVLFDFTGDGKKDLIVANYGNFISSSGSYVPHLMAFQNIGTATHPTYSLQSTDFAGLYSSINKTALYPAFGDLDNDGDEDMIVGDFDGNIHRFTNTAGVGNPAAFTLTTPLMSDAASTVIDVGKYATPLLVDLDRDGDLDLIIGEQNANLNYYKNTGTTSAPQFTKITDTLGGVHVNEYWTPLGYSVPAIYDNGGQYVLMVGSQKGVLYQYNHIDGNLNGTFDLVDSLGYNRKVGGRVGAAIGNFNNDALPDMIVGNYRGGLALYYGTNSDPTGIHEQGSTAKTIVQSKIFPNPAVSSVTVMTNVPGTYAYSVSDLNGKCVMTGTFTGDSHTLNTEGLDNGIYFIHLSGTQIHSTHKFVKCAKQ